MIKNKKFLLLLLIIFTVFLMSGCGSDEPDPNKQTLSKHVINEERACFDFFWDNQTTNDLLGGCGLIPDRYPSNSLASIASVGFGLASFVIGVNNQWITREEGETRAYMTLAKLKDITRVEGFYYHFYYDKTGKVASGSEVSNIDTSLFLCGALTAGEFFGGRVESMANAIYNEVNWPWFVNKGTNNFHMSYNPSSNSFAGQWDTYSEALMMYFLAAGSPTHPIDKIVYDSFTRYTGSYKGETFINSWFGSLFTYQFSHAFIDFRNLIDDQGVNWYTNSVNATLANYNYCVDHKNAFVTFSEKSWGLTACDTPSGYSGLIGTLPSGNNGQTFKNDGTVAPAGAIGSIVFAPDLVIPAINYYATMLEGDLIGDFGFYDAFNCEDGKIWIAKSVIGIDKGISILMIENYRSELIWDTFMKLDLMDRAIERLEFTKTSN